MIKSKSTPKLTTRQKGRREPKQQRQLTSNAKTTTTLSRNVATKSQLHHPSTSSQQQSSLKSSQITIQQVRSFSLNLSSVSGNSNNKLVNDAPQRPATPTTATTTTTTTTPTLRQPAKAPLLITAGAANRILDLCSSQDPPAKGIRLGVRTRGCSGLSYTMNFAIGPLSRIEEQIAIPNTDIKVFIDNKALLYVIGTTMDWTETDVSTEFTFTNPNSKGSCGCGESFTV
jgi:iron-sulfur cluster assembly protein